MLSNLKAKVRFLANTPLHPQWLLRANSDGVKAIIAQIGADKSVLDIGCFNKWAERHLPKGCSYIGLDYYQTANEWYGSIPDVYGNALALPLAPESFDVVLLIDVLEHIEDARKLLEQIHLVLKPEGKLLISVPFLYPIHDAPRDFVRLTVHGLKELAGSTRYEVSACNPVGSPITTATLLFNIAITKAAINWVSKRKVWSVFTLLIPPIILLSNILAKALSNLEVGDGFMPNSYHVVLIRR